MRRAQAVAVRADERRGLGVGDDHAGVDAPEQRFELLAVVLAVELEARRRQDRRHLAAQHGPEERAEQVGRVRQDDDHDVALARAARFERGGELAPASHEVGIGDRRHRTVGHQAADVEPLGLPPVMLEHDLLKRLGHQGHRSREEVPQALA